MKGLKFTPAFQQVFAVAVGFTLLSGGASLWLASIDTPSQQQTRVFETCTTTWNMGIGAIFGLLGSKATDLFQLSNEDEDNKEK